MLEQFLDRIAHVRIPVLVGIFPLASHRNAEFLNNEVPGIVVPPAILERMKAREGREEARAEGIAIAREILQRVKGRIEGAVVSAPFGRYETAVDVIEGLAPGSSEAKRGLA